METQTRNEQTERTEREGNSFLCLLVHPNGIRRTVSEMNEDLRMGPIYSSITRGIGLSVDIAKYVPAIVMLSKLSCYLIR